MEQRLEKQAQHEELQLITDYTFYLLGLVIGDKPEDDPTPSTTTAFAVNLLYRLCGTFGYRPGGDHGRAIAETAALVSQYHKDVIENLIRRENLAEVAPVLTESIPMDAGRKRLIADAAFQMLEQNIIYFRDRRDGVRTVLTMGAFDALAYLVQNMGIEIPAPHWKIVEKIAHDNRGVRPVENGLDKYRGVRGMLT